MFAIEEFTMKASLENRAHDYSLKRMLVEDVDAQGIED
jgi:hypothetical protein